MNNRKYSLVHWKRKTCWFGNYSKTHGTLFIPHLTPSAIHTLLLNTNRQNLTLTTFFGSITVWSYSCLYFKWHASHNGYLDSSPCTCQDRLVAGSPIFLTYKGFVLGPLYKTINPLVTSAVLERGPYREAISSLTMKETKVDAGNTLSFLGYS